MNDTLKQWAHYKIRGADKWASQGGGYHAARSRDGRSRKHEGLDLEAAPGTIMLAPWPWAKFLRRAVPYPDSHYPEGIKKLHGLWLQLLNNDRIKILYVIPPDNVGPGHIYRAGDICFEVEDLSKLYLDIRNHFHVEYYLASGERVDPTPYIFGRPGPGVAPVVTA